MSEKGLNISNESGSFDSSSNKWSPIKETDSVKKKLKKMRDDHETSIPFKNVCLEVLGEIKSLHRAKERLQIQLEQREEDIEKLSEKLKAAIEEKQKAKNITELVVQYAKRLACPTRLRRSMELFPIRFNFSIGRATKDQRKILSKLLYMMDSKTTADVLSSCVIQLASVSSKSPNDHKSAFVTAFTRMKDANLSLFPCSDTFGTVIYNLNLASDIDIAFKMWENALVFWQSKANLKELPPSDEIIIKKLTVIPPDVLVQRIKQGELNLVNENVCGPHQLEYAEACLKTHKIFNPETSKQYKQVLWTLYMSPNVEIEELWKELEKEWPSLERHQRADCYSTEFAKLYNLVSIVDKHGAGLQPPLYCEPSENDFDDYIRHLAVTENDKLCFVAKTLCC